MSIFRFTMHTNHSLDFSPGEGGPETLPELLDEINAADWYVIPDRVAIKMQHVRTIEKLQ